MALIFTDTLSLDHILGWVCAGDLLLLASNCSAVAKIPSHLTDNKLIDCCDEGTSNPFSFEIRYLFLEHSNGM